MRGIEHLHPIVQIKARELQALCDSKGLKLLITETFRTTAEQDALYAQGRTSPGKIVTNCKGNGYQSPHQWGVAFDFCKNIKGQEYSDAAFFKTVGQLAKSIGLFWGGDFKSFVDTPHLELATEFLPNNSTATLKSKYGTPEKFKSTWGSGKTSAVTSSLSKNGVVDTVRATIRNGSRGEDVKYLQQRLNALTGAGLITDGVFGAKTQAAVVAFQKARGLMVDGIVGANTWATLGI